MRASSACGQRKQTRRVERPGNALRLAALRRLSDKGCDLLRIYWLSVCLCRQVSRPGSSPQFVHADATSMTPGPLLLTAFISLQPITRDMGPTRFVPFTHNIDGAHSALISAGDATALTLDLARRCRPDIYPSCESGSIGEVEPPWPSMLGLLETGECSLYDGRLLHCGGANRSSGAETFMPHVLRAYRSNRRLFFLHLLDRPNRGSCSRLPHIQARE